MSSKKSSQAQPNRHPDAATIPSAVNIEKVASPSACVASNEAPFDFQCPGWPPVSAAVISELTTLISSGDWAKYQPAVLDRLRSTIASFLECKHVRLVSSGSAAIEMALRAAIVAQNPQSPIAASDSHDLASPPEVICPAFDYPGNARAVRLLGAVPVLVDSLPLRWTIDPDAVLAAATPRTVAVIASHLYGEIAAVPILREVCDSHGWILLEDVCQMPGGRIENKPLGTFGHIAAWSFGGSKPLTAGCGGAITTNDDRIAQRLAAYAERPSDAYPLSPLQAAALLPQWLSLADMALAQNQKLTRLVDLLSNHVPAWALPAPSTANYLPVFYKIPVSIDQSLVDAGMTPQRIIDQANELMIPAGQPFRIPGRLAPSRGRIESTQHVLELASRSWLIDHRVLATDNSNIDRLAEILIHLYNSVSSIANRTL